jgi:MatE
LLAAVLGTTPETATLAVMYLRVRCFACPAFLLYNVGTGNFRGRKDTRTPLLAYMANNITYILLVSHVIVRGYPIWDEQELHACPCVQLKSTAASSHNYMPARRSCYLFLASIGA